MSACANPSATPELLERLCGDGSSIDVNRRKTPRTVKWSIIFRYFEMLVRRGRATSDFELDMAHDRGGTALHTAARNGHAPLVRWLLEHGARPSLRIRNAMGCTPLGVSRVFGPFRETEAVLTQAVLSGRAS